MVQRVAPPGRLGQEDRRPRVGLNAPCVQRQGRHQEQGRAVEVAGDSHERRKRRPGLRRKGGERRSPGKPHEALGVRDRLAPGGFRIGRGLRHGAGV